MKPPEKIRKLRLDLAAVKEQRDRIRVTRDELKEKLASESRMLVARERGHFELWRDHIFPHYDAAMPDASLVEHIAYMQGCELDDSVRLLHQGYLAVQQIQHVMDRHAVGLPRSVLDFGCGCGRLTRYLRVLGRADTRVVGCDVDVAAIAWAKENLRQGGEFFASPDNPPLPLDESERFDLIVVASVFTHLPEDMQDAWLAELTSRLNPGGAMIATFHGGYFYRFIPEGSRERFHANGFLHTDLGRTPGLPGYYLTTFHTPDYIRSHWGRFGELVAIEEAAVSRQDAAIIRRRF